MADRAEKWLKRNDPEYINKHKLEYAYFSSWVEHKIKKREIPCDPMTIKLLSIDRNIIS